MILLTWKNNCLGESPYKCHACDKTFRQGCAFVSIVFWLFDILFKIIEFTFSFGRY